jgi:hypothetical protein
MTVKEMLEQLKQKFVYVAPVNLPKEQKEGLIGPFMFNAIKKVDDTSVANVTLKIYVKDLNMPTEEVFFDGYNPFKEVVKPDVTFANEVNNYIQDLINNGDIEYAKIENINEDTKRAFVWVFKIGEDGSLIQKALIISKQEDGTLISKEANA